MDDVLVVLLLFPVISYYKQVQILHHINEMRDEPFSWLDQIQAKGVKIQCNYKKQDFVTFAPRLRMLSQYYWNVRESVHSWFSVTSQENPGCLQWNWWDSLSSMWHIKTDRNQTETHRSKAFCFVFSILRYLHEWQCVVIDKISI